MVPPGERWIDARDATLRCVDYGGDGPPVLLLHGLAGCAREWDSTADWLRADARVFALDQRAHGESSNGDLDVRRARYVADVVATIAALDIAPATLVGQSMGGLNAYLAAAHHPELVRALIVAECGITNDPATPATIAARLGAWPTPFADRESATRYFGGDALAAHTWAAMLRETPDGLWPPFVLANMVDSVRDADDAPSYEREWARVACPTLVVTAEGGGTNHDVPRMLAVNRRAVAVEIAGAGHDVHLDRPGEWRDAVRTFLRSLRD